MTQRTLIAIAAATLLAGCASSTDGPTSTRFSHSWTAGYAPSDPSALKPVEERGLGLAGIVRQQAETDCLPGVVQAALAGVAAKFGEVTVTSTGRKLRKGGRKGSMHLSCRAADFRVKGSTDGMMAWLRQQKGLGGVKRYPNGIIHIDNGPKRTW